MAKRRCLSDHSTRVSKRVYERSNIDVLLESLFAESDSIDASFDGLVESRSTDSDQNEFIQRVLHLGSVLLEAGKRSVRKRSSVHNGFVWPLPPDLTVKVFSMLDTRSLSSATATCSFFLKCAKDRLCYADIDLATLVPKVNDAVVSTMIQRAGNALQSIRLALHTKDKLTGQENESSILRGFCLRSLSANGGAPGSRLRRLHLYHIENIDNTTLFASLSVCPSLADLEVVGFAVDVIGHILESVSRHCHLIQRFIYISEEGVDDSLKNSACKEFVLNCPKITTLALRGCELYDSDACELVKGFHKLKYVDFSTSYLVSGAFLDDRGGTLVGTKRGGNKLQVMLLRDCFDLDKVEVEKFMEALLEGKFRLLRHLDISNYRGLAYNGDFDDRHYGVSSILIKQLKEQRPTLHLVAEYPRSKHVEID